MSSSPAGNQWYLNGVSIQGAIAQAYNAVENGDYAVIVTLNGCSSDMSNSITMVITGMTGNTAAYSVNIYPNPNNGHFTLSINTGTNDVFDLMILNNLGVSIFERKALVVNGSLNEVIDLLNLPVGVYSVMLNNKERQIIRKVVIH